MKNGKKKFKFLAVLISAVIFSINCGLTYATVELPKLGQEVNENEKNRGEFEELKPLTKEEWEKEQLKKTKIWEENIEIDNKKENEFLEKNKDKYKDLNEKDLQNPYYDLIIFRKNGVPILLYIDKITKAKIVIILTDNLENLAIKENLLDEYCFRAFIPDDRGLVHFAEHCIACNMIDFKAGNEISADFNAKTKNNSLEIIFNGRKCGKDYIKNLFKELTHPEMLEDDELYKIEQKRIFNEQTKIRKELELDDSSKKTAEKYYNAGGDPEKTKKITKEEVKRFYENFIHPSNLLAIIYRDLNIKEIQEYLDFLHKEYLSHFNNKEIKIPQFRRKKDFSYLKEEYVDDLDGGRILDSLLNIKECKYWAELILLDTFNKENFKILVKHPALLTSFKSKDGICKIALELEEFVKKLGYEGIKMDNLLEMTLYGNKKELFEEKALQKAYKEIFDFVVEKIKTLTDKDLERNNISPSPYTMMRNEKIEDVQKLFANPVGYSKGVNNFGDNIKISYYYFGEPFSKDCFKITKDNEIIDSKQNLIEEIREDMKNLDKFKNKNPYSILVHEQGKPINNTENYKKTLLEFKKPFMLPIEFKKNENNPTLNTLAKVFLTKSLINKVTTKKIASHIPPDPNLNVTGGPIAVAAEPTEEFMKKHLDYYEKGNFKQDLNNFKITEKDFEDLKEAIKKDCSNYEEMFKSDIELLKRITRAIDYYLEHGLDENADVFDENKGGFKIDKKTTRANLARIILIVPQKFKSLEEKIEFDKAKADFIKKYGQKDYEKYKQILIDKEFVKELKEKILIPAKKGFHYADELNRKLLEEIDSVKFEDFVETVKSCDLMDGEKYEKDQKMLDSLREQIIQIIM